MIIISGGVRKKWNFQMGGPFCGPIFENPEGMGAIGKIPSVEGVGGYGCFVELHNGKICPEMRCTAVLVSVT